MSKSVLIIISGSIAAYKSLDVIRRLRERGIRVSAILTRGGAEFITPLSVASLSGEPVYSDLFSLKDESEMGHIRLSRESDLVAVVPASADIIAKMVHGQADDLATAALLATDKPVVVAPAMNTRMWENPATKRNIEQLRADGISIIEPDSGSLACGEVGGGRLAEVETVVDYLVQKLESGKPLAGLTALVTSGPTYEPVDPVRFIGNRSSGKQGNAIAQALSDAGAQVTLVTGPVSETLPQNVRVVRVETAQEMLAAAQDALPADIAVCCAAVSDWRVKKPFAEKLKKRANDSAPSLELVLNPDILHTLSTAKKRPKLVIGFAAETSHVRKHAEEKRVKKECDWILANDVSGDQVFGKDETEIVFVNGKKSQDWGRMSKRALARKLVAEIAGQFAGKSGKKEKLNLVRWKGHYD